MSTKPSDNREFFRFMQPSTEVAPPLSRDLVAKIRGDLAPAPALVFARLLGVHLASTLLTLSVCPQFGFRVWGDGMGLMHGFMRFGPVGCMIACGFFFMGVSGFLAGFFLHGEDIRAIRRHYALQISAVLMLSLGFFLMVSTESVILGLAAAWIAGAGAGGWGMLELGWRVRFSSVRATA